MTAVPVRELVELMLESSGRGVEPSKPFVNIRLPGGVSVADV